MAEHLSFGAKAEKVAENYLVSQGFKILNSNYYNPRGYRIGEVDLVAEDKKGEVVFVEVKARKGKKGTVFPLENITPTKIRKIQKAAQNYLMMHGKLGVSWRIDAVAVIFDFQTRKLHLDHVKYIRL